MSTQIAPIQKGETQIFPITVANAVMTADGQPYDSNLGDAYSSTTTYNAGQYCIYNNALWKSKVDSNLGNTPTESSYWTRTSVSDEFMETYSTDETVVGKWIDGKLIYRKTINLGINFGITSASSGTGVVFTNQSILPSSDGIKIFNSRFFIRGMNCYIPIAMYYAGGNWNYGSTINISASSTREVYLIIEYIK